MAWLESHQALGRHPKLRRLAALLKISPAACVGHLHYLWWWCLEYADDGNLARFVDLDIALGAEWEGDPEAFVAAMITAGFLDREGDALHVHDWWEYAGRLIDKREKNAERMRAARSVRRTPASAEADAPSRTCDAPEVTCDAPAPTCAATVPNPTTPYPTEPDQTAPEGVVRTARKRGAKPSENAPPGFERFWAIYPNRVERKAALAQWRAIGPDPVLEERIIAAIAEQLATRKWREGFVKGPHRWLRDRNWEDEPPLEPEIVPDRTRATERQVDAFLAIATDVGPLSHVSPSRRNA